MEHQNHSEGREGDDGFTGNYTDFLSFDFGTPLPDMDTLPDGFFNDANVSSNAILDAGLGSSGPDNDVPAAYNPFQSQQDPSQNDLEANGGLLDPSAAAGFHQLSFASTGQNISFSNDENSLMQMGPVVEFSVEDMNTIMNVSHYGPNATPQQDGNHNTPFTNGMSWENSSSNSSMVGNLDVRKQAESKGQANPDAQQNSHPSGPICADLSSGKNQFGGQASPNARWSSQPSGPKGVGLLNGQNQSGGQASSSAKKNSRLPAFMTAKEEEAFLREGRTWEDPGYEGDQTWIAARMKSTSSQPRQQAQGQQLNSSNNGSANGAGQDHARFFPGMKANTNPSPSNQPLRLDTSTTPKIDLTGATPTDLPRVALNDPEKLCRLFGAAVSARKSVPSNNTTAHTQKSSVTSADGVMAAGGFPAPTRTVASKSPITYVREVYQEGVAGAKGQMSTEGLPVLSNQSLTDVHRPVASPPSTVSRFKISDPKIEELVKSAYSLGAKYGSALAARTSHTLLLESMKGLGERVAVQDALGMPSGILDTSLSSPEKKKVIAKNSKEWRDKVAYQIKQAGGNDALEGTKMHASILTKLAKVAPEFLQSKSPSGMPNADMIQSQMEMAMSGGGQPRPIMVTQNAFAKPVASSQQFGHTHNGGNSKVSQAYSQPTASHEQLGFRRNGGNGMVPQAVPNPAATTQQNGLAQKNGNQIKPGVSYGSAQGNIPMPQLSQTGPHTQVYQAAHTAQGDMTGFGHSAGTDNGALRQSISRPSGGYGIPGGSPPLQAGSFNQPNQGSPEQQTEGNNGLATKPKRGKKRDASQASQESGQEPGRQPKAPKHTESTPRPSSEAPVQETSTTPSSAGSLAIASQNTEAPTNIESTRPSNDITASVQVSSLADASQNIKAPTTIVPTESAMSAPETVPSVPASDGKDSDALPDDSTGPSSAPEPIDFSEIDAMWERGKAELGMPAKPTPDPVLNTGSAEMDYLGIREQKNHAKRLAKKCFAVIDERIEKTGSAGDPQNPPVGGSGGTDDGMDEREVAAKAEFRRASLWLDKVLGPRSGPNYLERWDMDEFGLGFHMLEKIQKEGVPDEEMRQRNLLLANIDADILKVMPLYGPFKNAIDTEVTSLHLEIGRAIPAGLLKELEDLMDFHRWLANADMNGEAVCFLVCRYFLKLHLPRS